MKQKEKEVIFDYVEVINETEQLMIFTEGTGKTGIDLILNTALPVQVQDIQINKKIAKLLEAKK